MRNIEEIAAEEEARIREVALERLRTFLVCAWFGLSLWGWWDFRQGQVGKGATLLCASFACFGGGGGLFNGLRLSIPKILWGLLASGPPLGLYLFTRLPSFYWGTDPSFWLSVKAGAVGEPPWSPLSYLVGQSSFFLFPGHPFTLLPEVSAFVLSTALFLMMVEFISRLKNKTAVNHLLCLGICWMLGICLPFWDIGTMASGLPASLGLLFYILQQGLLNQEKKSWGALYLILGLLGSVHPLWAFLGALSHMGAPGDQGKSWARNLLSLTIGGSPYLWIIFRAGCFFPSWGGDHPFLEWVKDGKNRLHFQGNWGWDPAKAVSDFGWVALALVVLTFVLWGLNFFKWKSGNRAIFPAGHFWVWVLSGIGGFLCLAPFTGGFGVVMPAFLWGMGEMSVKLLERGMDKRHGTYLSGTKLSGFAGVVFLLALGAVFLPGQRLLRGQIYFPQQHALNLLQSTLGKSILVCDDPFEAEACRLARMIEPLSLGTVILEKKYLNRRWFVAQCVEAEPEILFPELSVSTEDALKGIVLNNRDQWAIHWAVSSLPRGWKEPKAFPTVLTQQFEGRTFTVDDPESVQYRFDLTALPRREEGMDCRSNAYLSRYVEGFNELGKKLMERGLYMASIHALDRALKLDPAFSEPQSLLAQMYSQQKILEAAQLEFEKTIKTHPQRINILMGNLEQAQRDKDEPKSVTLLDEMIRLNSELADAQYQLSVIYNRQGKNQESKALLESSVQLNPKQIEAQLTMGHLMARMGNRIKAEEAFRAVLGVNPENKEAQVELWKLLNK